MKQWAHESIDAGATMFVAHGVPILHGIEVYKGRPVFYSLGNFIFHSPQIGRWPALAWIGGGKAELVLTASPSVR